MSTHSTGRARRRGCHSTTRGRILERTFEDPVGRPRDGFRPGLPELGLGSEHYFNVATVKMGEKTVKVSGIPAGRYRAVRGADEAEVEVAAGKSVAVTLVRK